MRIRYFAGLRDQRGRSEEVLCTEADTVASLFGEIKREHDLDAMRSELRVAVNDAFCAWTRPLQEEDLVVFIPPVSGG